MGNRDDIVDEKVSQDDPSPNRTEAEGATVDAPSDEGAIVAGTDLGGRYHIRSKIGAGGMGEVWLAFDVKLRVDVALKALRSDLLVDQRRLDLLRREVRAAREVVSPNVCRIFDLIEAEGRELVSMEYIDGQTLLEVLNKRGPLELKEAQDIASQFLAGLEAIHASGLVHRDVKPENIMLTRAGRVVVMDFGLARQETEGVASVSGTPAYMAPEHAAGQTVDARADVYSAGVVLAEMVSPGGIKEMESRKSLWEGVRSEPPQLPDSPWAPVIKKAVAKQRDQRYNSAHTLTRALEDVTQRVAGAEDITPYPGLSSFTEEDAEYFFGRETEIEQIWRKLERPHLLAMVGPSGAGKTSFIRAGVIPNAGSGWAIVTCTPGNAAFRSLRQELASELAGDAEAMRELVDVEDTDAMVSAVSRWRRKNEEALLIVDQFEELFTLNPLDVQARFAELLGRLALEADVHVLLGMRDDFFIRCHQFPALAPLQDGLTMIGPPVGPALRRALVQPATKCGYRFEDDELVEEMLAEVEGERGALPTLAFAAARLWEKRDRDNGLLTRQAYQDIGGVGGALARHAEATIDRIGLDHVPIVRELFRNLVTAEGTRAVREVDELLSVFDGNGREGINPSPTTIATTPAQKPVGEGFIPSRDAALDVLHKLIDARLLTSYEVQEEEQEPSRQVEIVHESLLANWPRLVRWQTQDAEGAQLRDELRQAAQSWDEHGRPDDRLWTGSAYREFFVWRERYPGGLSETEEAFGEAMTRYAERRRRRRRTVVAATFVVLLGVLAVIGGFWRISVSEANRADAANLFSLGHLLLEEHPSATIAYAIACLERAENPEVRRLALEAMWMGPTELRLQAQSYMALDFSPDSQWLATADRDAGGHLWPSTGGAPTKLEGCDSALEILFSPKGDLVAANIGTERREIGLWSVPEGRFLRSFTLDYEGTTRFFPFTRDGERLITSTQIVGGESTELVIRSWPVGGGAPVHLARLPVHPSSNYIQHGFDPIGSRFAWADGRTVHIAPLVGTTLELSSTTSIEHDRAVAGLTFDPQGLRLATNDTFKTIRIWSLDHNPPEVTHTFGGGKGRERSDLRFDPSGTMLFGSGALWDLAAPPEAEPLRLRRSGFFEAGLAFEPKGDWVATAVAGSVSLWPLAQTYPRVLRGHEGAIMDIAFTPDGDRLISTSRDGSVRVWPLGGGSGERSLILDQVEGRDEIPWGTAMPPDESFVAVSYQQGQVKVLPLDGGPGHELKLFTDAVRAITVGPESRLVAAGSGNFFPEEAVVRVWDLESNEVRTVDAGDERPILGLKFTDDGGLWVYTLPIIRRWDLSGREPRLLEEHDLSSPGFINDWPCAFDPDSRQILQWDDGSLWFQHLDTLESRKLMAHAGTEGTCSWDPSTDLVITTDRAGDIRVGPATGSEHHLLPGRKGGPLVVSPDGRWIASGGKDNMIRLWPIPDLEKPPLHNLPREELIAKLKTLTNLRVVRDEQSATGWKIEVGPFPGWETVPEW